MDITISLPSHAVSNDILRDIAKQLIAVGAETGDYDFDALASIDVMHAYINTGKPDYRPLVIPMLNPDIREGAEPSEIPANLVVMAEMVIDRLKATGDLPWLSDMIREAEHA